MSFRNFASTFREQASARAKEAANKLQALPTSLPTFDDMAANDEYIHSDDFNVRGQPKNWKKDQSSDPHEEQQHQQSHHQHTIHQQHHSSQQVSRVDRAISATATTSSSQSSHRGGGEGGSNHVPETVNFSIGLGGDEASACTTESSWSLLDRQPNNIAGVHGVGFGGGENTSNYKSDRSGLGYSNHERQDFTPSQPSKQQHSNNNADSTDSTAVTKVKGRHSPTPLLSVVANALEETPSRSNTTARAEANRDVLNPFSQSKSLDRNYFDDEDEDDDEDDPIMKLMRKDNAISNNNDINNKSVQPESNEEHKKRNPNRFMDDLEKRMNTADNVSSLIVVEGSAENEVVHPVSPTSTPTGPFKKGPFGGYFLNLAVSSATKILKRPDGSTVDTNIRSPPLARDRVARKMKSNLDGGGDDVFGDGGEYNVTSSTSMLADEDMARLNQLKQQQQSGGNMSMKVILDKIRSNRRFVFVFVTFVVCLIVYYYLSREIKSDLY